MVELLRALPPLWLITTGVLLMGVSQAIIASVTFGRPRQWLNMRPTGAQVVIVTSLAVAQTLGLVLLNLGIAFWMRAGT